MFTLLSLSSVGISLVYAVAELLTNPWQAMAFGGSLQNLSPF